MSIVYDFPAIKAKLRGDDWWEPAQAVAKVADVPVIDRAAPSFKVFADWGAPAVMTDEERQVCREVLKAWAEAGKPIGPLPVAKPASPAPRRHPGW